MLPFLARRVVAGAVTLLVASFVLFAAIQLLQGDPVRALFGPGAVDPVAYQQAVERLHLDEPFLVQYGYFLRNLLSLDFGETLRGAPIGPIIRARLPVSLRILGGVFLLQLVLAPALLWLAGMRPRTRLDNYSNAAAVALVSVPSLVAAFMIQAMFAYWTNVFESPTWMQGAAGGWRNYVMPILALGVGAAAHLAVVGREELLVALSQPYVKVARGFGLPHDRIVRVQALRPAAGPLVQLLGANMAVLVTGLIVVEDIFRAPGLGTTLLDAIHAQDRSLILGLVMLVLVGVIVVNTLGDLAHAWLDPRVRDRIL